VNADSNSKVQARHLKRDAYLYIRQSSLRQVFENTESTKRQYALKQRAIALGWPADRIRVIDSDQGQSGASAADREGFQKLVAEVGVGKAGLVMGLEVSRLARNSTDWHRLLEICALSDTLILDEDGVYDPAHFNDRLLLGLKGTMSEAELHLLRARLLGGILNKARRGELECPLPIGLVYDAAGNVVLHPDKQVQHTIRHLFQTFRRTGSATATVKVFRQQGLKFPRRVTHGPHKGDVAWGELEHSRVLYLLHNPRLAGAFAYGRSRQRKHGPCGRYHKLPREEWTALLRDVHPGYITWDEYEENQRRLRDNSAAHGGDRRRSPPREGPALLQGLVICGVCGKRMTVRYHQQRDRLVPDYTCQRQGIERAEPICQCVNGAVVDDAISRLLCERVNPMALEVALAVQQEMQARLEEADRLRRKHIERAQYEAELARRRYMRVDPDNRLVADSLEADWNAKLRGVTEACAEYERQRQQDRVLIDEDHRARVLALATDFPRVWTDPGTADRDRKRMVRLLIEDLTLIKGTDITVHVRFRGGTTKTLHLPLPLPAWALRQTSPEVIAEVDRLLDDYTDAKIAVLLTDRGFRSGAGKPINDLMVWRVRRHYGLKPRYQRLRERGMLTKSEIARRLRVVPETIKVWRLNGLLPAHPYNDKGQCLYEPPGADAPVRYKWKGLTTAQSRRSMSKPAKGVQCEA
jgi:DNA invertase Pin-like site-specific DNA recombinase